ncbi:DUF2971 domain-containing protein [Streptococcus cameli]
MVQILFNQYGVNYDRELGIILKKSKQIKLRDTLAYFPTRWSDSGYYFTYDCYYFNNRGGVKFVGKAKVFNTSFFSNSKNREFSSNFPNNKQIKKQDFKSLGLTFSYYKRLNDIFQEQYRDILKRIKDCFESDNQHKKLRNFLNTQPSEKSLLSNVQKYEEVILSSDESKIIHSLFEYLESKTLVPFNRVMLLSNFSEEVSKIENDEFSKFLMNKGEEYLHRVESFIFFEGFINYYQENSSFKDDDVKSILKHIRNKFKENIFLRSKIDRLLDTDLSEIEQIIQNIKKELLVVEADTTHLKLGHFSNLEIYKKILEIDSGKMEEGEKTINSNLRLTNANQLNDPLEGRALYKFLKLTQNSNCYEQSDIYMICATTNLDSLPMWEQYGNHSEGISITFTKDFINEVITKSKADIYKVCYLYLEGKKIKTDGLDLAKSSKIEDLLEKLSEKIQETQNYHYEIIQMLKGINYLFKKKDYAYENEYRIILDLGQHGESIDIVPMYNPKSPLPFLYTYLDNLSSDKYSEIIFGPKTGDWDYLAPYLLYLSPGLKIIKSEIDFR